MPEASEQLRLFARVARVRKGRVRLDAVGEQGLAQIRERELIERFRELPEHDQDVVFQYVYRLLGRPRALPPWASGEMKRTWAAVTRLTPVQFEDFAGLLLCAQGYRYHPAHREHRDNGISLLLKRRRARYAVMCKLRTVKNVGLAGVDKLESLLRAAHLRRGVIITNAGFTDEARDRHNELAARSRGVDIALIDSRRIHAWLHNPKFAHARDFLSSPRSEMWQAVLAGYGKKRRRSPKGKV
ncbi:MAG: restriction endonuclease [Armatimonadota bacterium]